MEFQIPLPVNGQFGSQMVLSPDGHVLAGTSSSPAEESIRFGSGPWTHCKPDRFTHTRVNPFFWSADSRFIVYDCGNQAIKIDVWGGPPPVLCDAPLGVIGGVWTKGTTIVLGQSGGPLLSVPASGGVPTPISALDPSKNRPFLSTPAVPPPGRPARHLLHG
jgi:hypothetical protein